MDMEMSQNKKRKYLQDIDSSHGLDQGTIFAPISSYVNKVLVKDGMEVEKDQPVIIYESQLTSSSFPHFPVSELRISEIKKTLERRQLDNGFSFTEDVLVDQGVDSAESSPLALPANEYVPKRCENFKRFDFVSDHSDHLFSAETLEIKQPTKDWVNKIREEWGILKEHLPETILVRAYEPRMDLLRAVIVGPEGTPYHHGLFFFDICFTINYPYSPPLLLYRSGALGAEPNVKRKLTARVENIWWHDTYNMLQLLVSIHGLILNAKPFFNELSFGYLRGSYVGEIFSFLYNENTLVNTIKTMVYVMNKPPKNFEDFVVGHFRKRVTDILIACKAYTKGLLVGCLGNGKYGSCSIQFQNDVASCIKFLVEAFKKIGAKEAQEFQQEFEYRTPLPLSPDIDTWYGLDDDFLSGAILAVVSHLVVKVLVKDGMKVDKGQPLYVFRKLEMEEDSVADSSNATTLESTIKQTLEDNQNSRVGIFSMEDVLVDQDEDDIEIDTMLRPSKEDVLKRFENFKKFDTVVDYSDHFFLAQSSAMIQAPEDWVNHIHEEWRILEEHLPQTISVRVYESRIDLLRAVCIGPEGTAYHHGLFFFDVCFPINYPSSPPLVHYRSGGLGINPNLYKCGKVYLSLPKMGGDQEKMWMPGTTTLLQLLVSIQNRIFNHEPLFNDPTYAVMRGSVFGKQSSLLYNENILIKSLNTMVYIMNKPPKNFEDFVVGYFHKHARDILMMTINKEACSVTFKDDLVSCIRLLVVAFTKIGAK